MLIPYSYSKPDKVNLIERSYEFLEIMKKRRTIRYFSDEDIPDEVIENIIMTAGYAPSGANMQPWKFIVVKDKDVKSKIRIAAEKEEFENYNRRFSESMKLDLEKLKLELKKEYITQAPVLIVVFKEKFQVDGEDTKKNYYVNESVGLACGIMLSAITYCGLVTLTYTPSPMKFLSQILNRPENESPYMVLPIGYPAENAKIPQLTKKSFEEIAHIW